MPEKTGVKSTRTVDQSPTDPEVVRQEIETRAYFRFCERGCEPGRALEDWLAAEQEVLAKRNHGSHSVPSETADDPPVDVPPDRRRRRR